MNRLRAAVALLVLLTLSCNLLPAPGATPGASTVPTPERPATPARGEPLAEFELDPERPFAAVEPVTWRPGTFGGEDYPLPLDLSRVGNEVVLSGTTEEQRTFLAAQGFFVMHSQEPQFYTLRENVGLFNDQPYYLTTDAAFHALHLTFNDLLEALEREALRPRMAALLAATQDEMLLLLSELEGTAIEEDARLATAYLAVATRLFDPAAPLPAGFEEQVTAQVEQIMAEGGQEPSILIPNFEDDYGAYRPVGHYAGDPELEAYFRGMTWLGRVHFELKDADSTLAPLLITLALRRAEVDGRPAVAAWSEVHEVLTFLVGPTDDGGPPEYAALMDEIYGPAPAAAGLADESRWAEFVERREEIPAPRINSTFVASLTQLGDGAGWRFMGQRLTLDSFIFQNMVFDGVEPLGEERRLLPSGPDVMAVLGGSSAAVEALEEQGALRFPNFEAQLDKLRGLVEAQARDQWLSRAYDAWLYALRALVEPKDGAYPSYKRSQAWNYREMNSALGSWVELKHDTILYAKMPEGAGGGGPPCVSGPPPGYVEPNPEAFYRMAYVAGSIAQGLLERELAQPVSDRFSADSATLDGLTWWMDHLAGQLGKLGDIAARELAGEALNAEDYAVIHACLGVTECTASLGNVPISQADAHIDPPPVVAAVAGSPEGQVLQAATGYVDRIYVVVPIEGRMEVAQGGVYSYYEFTQPRSDRLTDEAWRARLDGGEAPELPAWTAQFMRPGGAATDRTGFHPGTAYMITEAGSDLNLRAEPGLAGTVVEQLAPGAAVQIIGGPVEADGFTWWQFNVCGSETDGWAVQESAWYERIY